MPLFYIIIGLWYGELFEQKIKRVEDITTSSAAPTSSSTGSFIRNAGLLPSMQKWHTRLANEQFGLDGIEIREACIHPANIKFEQNLLLKVNTVPVTSAVGIFGRFLQPGEI